MISQKQLLAFSVFFALVGVFSFILLAANAKPVALSPNEVTFEKLGVLVQVEGAPAGVSSRESRLSFLLCNQGCVSVRAGARVGQSLQAQGAVDKLRERSWVIVVGVVKEYAGEIYLQVLEPGGLEFLK